MPLLLAAASRNPLRLIAFVNENKVLKQEMGNRESVTKKRQWDDYGSKQ